MILTSFGSFADEKEYNREREKYVNIKLSTLQKIVWAIWPTRFSTKVAFWKSITKLKEE